jgi:hypothetical protein
MHVDTSSAFPIWSCCVPQAYDREPQANWKAYLHSSVSLQFRKLLDGFQKAHRKVTGSCCSTWVPEGFQKTVWKGTNHLVSQVNQCKQSLSTPQQTYQFEDTSLYGTDRFLSWRTRGRIQQVGDLGISSAKLKR